MSDTAGDVPPEGPDTFLDGSEPVGDEADDAESSQALMPSDLGEPAEYNGRSGGEGEQPA